MCRSLWLVVFWLVFFFCSLVKSLFCSISQELHVQTCRMYIFKFVSEKKCFSSIYWPKVWGVFIDTDSTPCPHSVNTHTKKQSLSVGLASWPLPMHSRAPVLSSLNHFLWQDAISINSFDRILKVNQTLHTWVTFGPLNTLSGYWFRAGQHKRFYNIYYFFIFGTRLYQTISLLGASAHFLTYYPSEFYSIKANVSLKNVHTICAFSSKIILFPTRII